MNMQSSLSFDDAPFAYSIDDILRITKQWRDLQALRPLDYAIAKGIVEIAQEGGVRIQPVTVLLASISSLYLSDGHVCLDLDKLMQKPNEFLRLPVTSYTNQEVPTLAQVLSNLNANDIRELLHQCNAVTIHQRDNASPSQRPFSLKGSRFYLSRFFDYEHTIATGIHARLPVLEKFNASDNKSLTVLKQAIEVLFKHDDPTTAGSQMRACALAARSRFSIITGGPGTGKTTTVVKLLAALQAMAGDNATTQGQKLRIALAAPTGKASARLNMSISESVGQLPLAMLPGNVEESDIPVNVKTIHQLLGSKRNSRLFIHHQQNPLPVDVLVIDEASMVDVSLMASVVLALHSNARLILLGDKDQLASVDAGAVLGQLAKNAHQNHYSEATCTWLQQVLGQTLVPSYTEATSLAQNITMLDHSFRFDGNSGIGKLAKMVNSGNVDNTLLSDLAQTQLLDSIWLIDESLHDAESLLTGSGEPKAMSSNEQKDSINTAQSSFVTHVINGSVDLFKHKGKNRLINDKPVSPPQGYQQYFDILTQGALSLNAQTMPHQWDEFATKVLQSFDRFQVLCAMRKGPYGVEQLNALIEQTLVPKTTLMNGDAFYQGRPILMTRNDYNLGLTNGDVGIVINKWVQNVSNEYTLEPRVAFPSNSADAAVRWFSPSRLQSIETVYAMTVHKSQGSEFEHACVVLPDVINAVVTKELLYTAITRAKNWISIVSPNQQVLTQAINNPISRESGLSIDAIQE